MTAGSGSVGGVLRLLIIVAVVSSTELASAEEADSSSEAPAFEVPKSAATEVTRVAYTHTAFGSAYRTVGAAAFSDGRGSFERTSKLRLGGGIRVWGAPIERVTLLADGERRETTDAFAPSISVQVRIAGDRGKGWAVAGLARYKTEGFAEIEGEAEFAMLVSYAQSRSHFDLNAVVGTALEERESDAEAAARAGYDVLPFLRLGAEARFRRRIAGTTALPGGRDWDLLAGPQLLVYSGAFFGALTGGPSTVGLPAEVGWTAIATLGGAAF